MLPIQSVLNVDCLFKICPFPPEKNPLLVSLFTGVNLESLPSKCPPLNNSVTLFIKCKVVPILNRVFATHILIARIFENRLMLDHMGSWPGSLIEKL